jgi:allophanate hydrolase
VALLPVCGHKRREVRVRGFVDLALTTLDRTYEKGAARPSDLVSVLYDRIGPGGPDWIFLRPRGEALAACAEVEARRRAGEALPLYGVPFGVKDNIDVAGMPTTAACPAFSRLPSRSARSVELLLRAGAICLGKTNLDQFATGLSGARSPYGACASIGNPLYVSGGSSSGSAVVVATGHVAFALGTDTGGSGRIPAGFNGIVGVKPTAGRVSTRGLVPNCPSLDCVSVFALSVDDGARVLDVIDGFDPDDPFSRRPPARAGMSPPHAFTFGVLAARDREWYGMPECAALYEAACRRLARAGGTPVEIDFAPFREAGRMLFDGPWIAERRAALAPFIAGNRNALLEVTRAILDTADGYDAETAFAALHRLAELRRMVEQQFGLLAAIVVPTAPRPFTIAEMFADPIGLNNRLGHYSYFANLLDLCALALPNGVLGCGVPMGVTLLAPAWCDERLIAIARRLEAGGVEVDRALAVASA